MADGISLDETAKEAGVSLDYLNQQISDGNIINFANYCTPIDVVGSRLGLSHHVLSDLDDDHKTAESKRIAMLKKWKNQFSFKATYKELMEVLIASRKADDVYKMCCSLAKEEGRGTAAAGGGNPPRTGTSDSQQQSQGTLTQQKLVVEKFEDLPLTTTDFVDIMCYMSDMVEMWNDLGLALGLDLSILNPLEADKTNSRERMKAVIQEWLKGKGSDPTWQTLCTALRHKLVQRKDMAEQVEKDILKAHK